MSDRPDPRRQHHLQLLAEELVLELPAMSDALADAAAAAASGSRSCGITYRSLYGAVTVASNGGVAAAVDGFQYDSDDGPCLAAMRTGVPSRVDDTATEVRWPPYPRLAAAAGVRSSLSYPLVVDDESVGALNVYSPSPGPWPIDDDAAVIVLGHQVGEILRTVRDLAMRMLTDPGATEVFRARHDRDIATGILMARHRLSDTEAGALLASESVRRGLPEDTVVHELVHDLRHDQR